MKYAKIKIDDKKDPINYTTYERRAEVWRRIQERGDPKGVSQTALAKHYGVSQNTIWRDIQAIKGEVIALIGNEIKFRSDVIYSSILTTLSNSKGTKDIPVLIKAIESYNNWLFNIGAQEKAPGKIRLEEEKSPTSPEELNKRIKELLNESDDPKSRKSPKQA